MATLAMSISLSAQARVSYSANKKTLTAFFSAADDEIVTMDSFKRDWYDAVQYAIDNKYKCLIFQGANGEYFQVIKGNEQLYNADWYWSVLEGKIAKMGSTTYIQGEEIGRENVKVSGPKYVSETFINGKRDSIYESDWHNGPFPTETSTYKSGGDTYVTKTYYRPAKYEEKIKYAPGKRIVVTGIEEFAKQTYFRE